jgi:tryptophan synthase alpha chain
VNRLDLKLSGTSPLLACYLPVGDPLFPPELADIYAACGVDIVELGMPSADPYLDGPDVAASMARGLAAGGAIDALVAATARIRTAVDGPAPICMCYADLDMAGVMAAGAFDGIDGLLMLGLESRADAAQIRADMHVRGIRMIRLVGDDLPPADLAAASAGDGYLMLQAAAGVTGPRQSLDPANASKITRLRAAALRHKLLLGFGISTGTQAAEAIGFGADGVVIGSMCVRKALEGPDALRAFLTDVRTRLDG